jgi:hypothetical protein
MLANMMGSLNQFVLVSARKSRGGEWWSPDDYDVRDNAQKSTGKSGRLFAGGESPPARMGFFAGDRIKGS